MDLEYKVIDDKYLNLREVLKNEFKISSRLLLKLMRDKKIFLNNEQIDKNINLKLGDIIQVDLNCIEDNSNIVPSEISLDILYEDEYILIVNKPSDMAVHPSLRHYTDCLSNGVKAYFDKNSLHRLIRPVNRLDKDTTGIVIFAKNSYIQECLILQMKKKILKKEYIGILSGILKEKSDTINAPIARKEGSIIERCIDENGQEAITHYEVIKEVNNISVVHFILETGRTHQIRVHSMYVGNPLLGDTLYATKSNLITRQALHAYKVAFIHPISKENIEITADLPDDMKKIIE